MKTQKTGLQRQCFFFVLAFLLTGCPGMDPTSGTLTEVYKYPKELWGEWIRMDTGKTWYITSNYMDNDASSNKKLELKKQSEKVIEVAEKDQNTEKTLQKYYLYASRIPNGSFSGAIVGDGSDRAGLGRSMDGMGGISVVVSNLNDAANEASTKTDGQGNFTVEGTIPGDKYEVTAGGQTTVVSPNTDGEDIGNVTVTGGANFKISINPNSNSVDMMRLYAGTASSKDLIFNIEVQNTGTENCVAAMYRITAPSGLVVVPPNGFFEDNLRTILSGKKRRIPIGVICDTISEESVYKTIGITITDVNKKVWNDSVSLKFNRESITFYITSDGKTPGVVIVPSAKAYYFSTSYKSSTSPYSASVTVPKYSNKVYLVAFSGATADTETKYSLGVGVNADVDFSGLVPSHNHEPNNTEDTATIIQPGETIKSYLHQNDIDYFQVRFAP
jgi:hypothetical protein